MSAQRIGIALMLLVSGHAMTLPAAGAQSYKEPPPAVVKLLETPRPAEIALDPARHFLLLADRPAHTSLQSLAEPMVSLAGIRFNPQTNGPHAPLDYTAFTLVHIDTGKSRQVRLPEGARAGFPQWSPDGSLFAFSLTRDTGVELWVGDPQRETTRRLTGPILNAIRGVPFQWMPDGRGILCRLVPEGRGPMPSAVSVPQGPLVMESTDQSRRARRVERTLRNPFDKRLFDHFLTTQLAVVDVGTGMRTNIGSPIVLRDVRAAPDNRHLLVARTVPPYSRLVGADSFPEVVEVWDTHGNVLREIARLPLRRSPVDTVAKVFRWRSTAPASLVWIEVLAPETEGEGAKQERLVSLSAPFVGEPIELMRSKGRLSQVAWLQDSALALVRDYDPAARRTRTWLVNAEQPGSARIVWQRRIDDRYADPGQPMTVSSPSGHPVVVVHQNAIFLRGESSAADGRRPYLDKMELNTLAKTRLWQAGPVSYETVAGLLTPNARRILTRHETSTSPPNYVVRDLAANTHRRLTHFQHPVPELSEVRRVPLRYKRDDGLELHATLYVPSRRHSRERLPVILWAYPGTYEDADIAEQVWGSRHEFTLSDRAFPLFFLLHGYAVLDVVAMPVVGDAKVANDTFVEQVVANARAAVREAVRVGVSDGQRVGVAGHSYGAFMVANLLAHSDMFRAGAALSGAYNRTLTPFGFQTERRSLWEAPDTYLELSPLMHADRIRTPLLLIHGERDDHYGTPPLQSRRLYQAIRGNGGVARLLLLPLEGHAYRARESVLHAAAEMLDWFDTYVKEERRVMGGVNSRRSREADFSAGGH